MRSDPVSVPNPRGPARPDRPSRPTAAPGARRLRGVLLGITSLALLGGGGCRGETAEPGPEAGGIAGLTVLDGPGLVEWIDSRRGTPLLLNFWATWCPPCVAELPDLARVAQNEAAQGVTTVLVSLDVVSGPATTVADAERAVPAFLAEQDIDLPCILVSQVDPLLLQQRFRLGEGIPVTVAIGANGEISGHHRGAATAEQFEELYGLARFEDR